MTISIILKQQRGRSGCTGNDSQRDCCCASRDQAPQWNYLDPPMELACKGLSAGPLQAVVEELNEQSLQVFDRNYQFPNKPCMLIMTLSLLCVEVIFLPVPVNGLCFCLTILFLLIFLGIVKHIQDKKAKAAVFEDLKQQVDRLNRQWIQSNICWEIKSEIVTKMVKNHETGKMEPHRRKFINVEVSLMQKVSEEYASTTVEGVTIPEPMSVQLSTSVYK